MSSHALVWVVVCLEGDVSVAFLVVMLLRRHCKSTMPLAFLFTRYIKMLCGWSEVDATKYRGSRKRPNCFWYIEYTI